MKILLLLLTTNTIGGGTANSVMSYDAIKTEYTQAMMDNEKINLTTQKMNSVNVDLTYLTERDSYTSEDIKEAVAVEIVVENSQYNWINDFLDSYLLNGNSSWSTIGINYSMPKENTSVEYKARLLPKYVEKFEGVMAIDITLTNGKNEELKDLGDLITNTNLGDIKDKKPETIKQEILNKNPDANGNEFEIDPSSITDYGATINGSPEYGYEGGVKVDYKAAIEKLDIDKVLVERDLGEIEIIINEGNPIDKSQLIKKIIIEKNNKLTENDFDVHLVTETLAVAEAKDDSNYFGKVEVTFTFKEVNRNLDQFNGDLGLIKNTNESTILNKFIQVNKGNEIDVNNLKLNGITNSSAILSPANETYIGSLKLTYVVEGETTWSRDHNINEDRRVDAGRVAIWSNSSDEDTYISEAFTINLNNYSNSLLNNLAISFDMEGTMVDIGDMKAVIKEPIQNLYFSDFKDQSKWTKKQVFEATSQEGADFVRGKYYINYKYNATTKVLTYQVEMYSLAYNGGNGAANTAGKGTNKIRLNTVEMKFNS